MSIDKLKSPIEQRPLETPFTIIVDSQEKSPFSFTALRADAAQHNRPYNVLTRRLYLGDNLGDYSLVGFEPARVLVPGDPTQILPTLPPPCVSIERKSPEDLQGRLLYTNEHRRITGIGPSSQCPCSRCNFERQLSRMNAMTFAAIVVEGDEEHAVTFDAPEWGKRSKAENSKLISRTLDKFRMEFPRVQWVFGSRRFVEVKTFLMLRRFWEINHSEQQ